MYRGLCFSKVEQGVAEDQSCPSTYKRATDVLLKLFEESVLITEPQIVY